MSNSHSSKNGRSNGSSKSSLQNVNPSPVAQASGNPSSNPDPGLIAATVQTLAGMASSLGIEPAESVVGRRSLTPDSIVPEVLTDTAVEVALKHPEIVEGHFDVNQVRDSRTTILALEQVAGQARGLVKELDDEILRRQAAVGSESLYLYRYLGLISRKEMGAPILEPLDRMTKAMRKGARGTSKAALARAAKAARAALAAQGASAPAATTPSAGTQAVTPPATSPPPTSEGTK